MEKFRIKIYNDKTVLFNESNIKGLNRGDIFYKNEDFQTVILQDFDYLDKKYIDKIIDTLKEDVDYDFQKLVNKTL